MSKLDPNIDWVRKQLANATKAARDLKSGEQKMELGGQDVTDHWIAIYEGLIDQYERLIYHYETRNRKTGS